MKTRNLTYLGGLAALAVAGIMLSQHADLDLTTDALAADGTGTYSVSCTETTQNVYTPTLASTITIAAAAATAPAVPTAATSISSGGVNSESGALTTGAVSFVETNYAIFTHTAPKSKITGLQCTTSTQSLVSARNNAGAETSATKYHVYVDDVGASQSSTAGKKIDGITPVVLFGTSGVIETTNILDNSAGTANDGAVDGEAVTGLKNGTDADADNLYTITHKVQVMGANPDSESEVIRMTFTPS